MKPRYLWIALLLAVALLLPTGSAFGQDAAADIEAARKALADQPNPENRLRLGGLLYMQGAKMIGKDSAGALKSIQDAVWVLEDGKGKPEETVTEFEEARYGLAYVMAMGGNPVEAVIVLEKALEANPKNDKVTFLMGSILMGSSKEADVNKGLDVLSRLAKEGSAPYNEKAARAASRHAFNLAAIANATGKSKQAAALMSKAKDSLGEEQAFATIGNENYRFATGVYLMNSDNSQAAAEEFEAVKKANPNYKHSNGTELNKVLSDTYYQAGREQLLTKKKDAGKTALEFFNKAGANGDANAIDIRHGKALSLYLSGDEEGAKKEADGIKKDNPEYFKKFQAKAEAKAKTDSSSN